MTFLSLNGQKAAYLDAFALTVLPLNLTIMV